MCTHRTGASSASSPARTVDVVEVAEQLADGEHRGLSSRRRCATASSRTGRRMPSISSKCSGWAMSGGESWMTGSPRSSARQIRPRRNSSPERNSRSSHSDSSSSKRLLRVLVLDELDRAGSSPRRATSPTIGMSRSESSISRNAALVLADVLDHALVLHDVDVRQRDRARHRVPGEREAVQERGGALEERLGDAVGRDDRAERRVRRRDALRGRDEVGLVVVALRAEPLAEPAPRADDLVGDHQHVVAVADLAHPLEVAVAAA